MERTAEVKNLSVRRRNFPHTTGGRCRRRGRIQTNDDNSDNGPRSGEHFTVSSSWPRNRKSSATQRDNVRPSGELRSLVTFSLMNTIFVPKVFIVALVLAGTAT